MKAQPRAMTPEVLKHIEYASGYLDLKMYEDAAREADEALALAPNNRQAIAIKSEVLWQSNRLKEAEPLMAKLAELNPLDSATWINLAYIRRRTQSLDAAVSTLQRAFDANPRNALAHYNMACYRAVQHREAEALELLRNAVHLDPKLKAIAKSEPDFSQLREMPAFQKLVNGRL
ncbi:MAG TPA: tetratricopeptide repeat protein [Verrucomicrobiae bacterium]|nr:tetratricopeptide repeat protein [Verrucomicrobiae bacterium]